MDLKQIKNMKFNKTYILITIAVLLTIFVSIIKGCSSNEYQNFTAKIVGYKAVPDLETNKIVKIIILNADKKRIVLNKTSKNRWEVLNLYKYSADSKKINSFLEAIKNARIIQTVVNNNEAVNRLGLDVGKEKISNSSSTNVN